jgi:hypothetical protein
VPTRLASSTSRRTNSLTSGPSRLSAPDRAGFYRGRRRSSLDSVPGAEQALVGQTAQRSSSRGGRHGRRAFRPGHQPQEPLQVRGVRRCRGNRRPDASRPDVGGARQRAAAGAAGAQADPRRDPDPRRAAHPRLRARAGGRDAAVHRDPAHGAGRGAKRHHRLPGLHRPACHVGTATGSDGRQYNLETDMRAMEGTYVAEDGSRQRGLFALI